MIGLFETELIGRPSPWHSLEAVEFATLTWLDGFDHRRLIEPIGPIPPAGAEAAFHDALEETPLAAQDSTNPASGKPGAVQMLLELGLEAKRSPTRKP